MYPKMKRVNDLLRRKSVKDVVWKVFGFDRTCNFPDFGEELLYGGVSDIVHNPGIRTIYVSDMDPIGYNCFFGLLASHQRRPFSTYDEKAAASFKPDSTTTCGEKV